VIVAKSRVLAGLDHFQQAWHVAAQPQERLGETAAEF
jgi:hypothetical protein